MSPKAIIISIFAGLASALCVMASFRVGAGASPLILIAAFPIYVATLSQGTAVGVGSSILAIMIAAIAISPQAAILLGAIYTIPASIIGNQANLGQETNGSMVWYPLSGLFFNLSIILCIGISLIFFLSDFNPETLATEFTEQLKRTLEANPRPQPINEKDLEQFMAFTIGILPFVMGGLLLIVHISSIHLAAKICRASNMMPRPQDDIALTVALPKAALLIMLASLALSMVLTGIVQIIAMLFAGTLVTAFSLIGLASLHLKLRNNSAATLILTITYIIILITYPLFYILSIAGILRTFNQSNTTPNSPPTAG